MSETTDSSSRAEKDIGVLNYFMRNTAAVLRDTVGVDIRHRAIRTCEKPHVTEELVVMVGVTGDLEGEVFLCLSKDFACKIVQGMGFGGEVYDDLAESAVCELANMVTGTALIEAQKLGLETDLSPPTILTGGNLTISVPEIPAILVDYESEVGELTLCVALMEVGSAGKRAENEPTPLSATITGVLTAQDMLREVEGLFERGSIDKAIRLCRHIVELNFAIAKKVAMACTREGARFLSSGRMDQALELLNVAHGYDEVDAQTNLQLGHVWRQKEEFERAQNHYLRAVGADPDLAEAYFWLGHCFERLGNCERACRSFGLAARSGYAGAEDRLAACEGARREAGPGPAEALPRERTAVIADDAMVVRVMIKDALEDLGFSVVASVSNGHQAVEACREHRPALVTLDLNMPGLGGVDALRSIRRDCPKVKGIIISVLQGGQADEEVEKSGASAFLHKPFKEDDLRRCLVRLGLLSD